jgi:putative DNA primase/helicase
MIDINRVLPVNPKGPPDEMKKYLRWGVWRLVQRGKKPAKRPLNPGNGSPLKTNDTRGWGSFDRAIRAYDEHRLSYDGVGFLLTYTDPFIAIDLDKCRNPKTGKIKRWAREIIKEMNSYTEISPSETGIRIIIKGKKSRNTRKMKAGDLEIFYASFYVTITGQYLNEKPHEIKTRNLDEAKFFQEAFKSEPHKLGKTFKSASRTWTVNESEIIKMALAAKNGAKFRRLFLHGDDSGHYSRSEADLALCGMLAFWTRRDPALMDSIFRKSGLFRKEKWDKRHYSNGKTYGEGTISRAIAGCFNIYGG